MDGRSANISEIVGIESYHDLEMKRIRVSKDRTFIRWLAETANLNVDGREPSRSLSF